MECEYCKDPARATTIFRRTIKDNHRVMGILDASPDQAGVTFLVVRLPDAQARAGRLRQFNTGFAVNYCPMCGRRLRDDNHMILTITNEEMKGN